MSGSGEPFVPETPREPGGNHAAGSSAPANVDWSDTLRSFQGNAGLMKVVMETFLEEAPSLRKRIIAAIDGNDAVELKIAAHSLKGAFRYLGIKPAFEEAFRLEKMGEMKKVTEARELLPTIEAHIASVASAVTEYLQRAK